MRFGNIIIEDKVKEKILKKHGVEAEEIKEILLNNPIVLEAKHRRYIAIGRNSRHITIIFEASVSITNIITAYPSSKAQIRYFKRKK